MSQPIPPRLGRRRRSTPTVALAVLLALTAALAACGGGDDDDATDRTVRTTTSLPPVPAGFDWWSFTELSLGGDWVLEPCEGADSSFCFDRGVEGTGGFVGIFRFDVPADFDLNVHAARFVEDFRTDRQSGCGAEYRVEAEPIESLTLPDGPARRYGFTGGSQNSADTERTIQWAGVRGTSLVIVTLSAYDPGSCVPAVGEATLDEQDAVLPAIDQLILAVGLPDPAGIPTAAG